ncbi:MAG: hypothetical protein ABID61_00900 [Candidatus Micrarchaeota archaeon]
MDNSIKARLLYALARKRKWGESHTDYENLFRQFKSSVLSKDILKSVRETAEELIRNGYIIKKPTGYGLQVSLNPKFSIQIKKLIKENLGYDL